MGEPYGAVSLVAMTFESIADRQIREAMERGEFSNLPGQGKPLPDDWYRTSDESWWISRKMQSEGISAADLVPPPVQLRRERDRIQEALRGIAAADRAREFILDLNRRIDGVNVRREGPPGMLVKKLDVDATLSEWRNRRSGR